MAIDLKPAEGRIILGKARATAFYPWYEPAGTITRIAGKRIYYKTDQGVEKFLHDFGVCCDTQEEEARLLEWSQRAKNRVASLHLTLREEDEDLISLSAAPARRTRKRS